MRYEVWVHGPNIDLRGYIDGERSAVNNIIKELDVAMVGWVEFHSVLGEGDGREAWRRGPEPPVPDFNDPARQHTWKAPR